MNSILDSDFMASLFLMCCILVVAGILVYCKNEEKKYEIPAPKKRFLTKTGRIKIER